MGISYAICQDVACQKNTVARGHCQACLRTVGKVAKKDDATAGALAKAIFSTIRSDPPVFVLHGQVSVPSDQGDGGPAMGIDVSHKASHYRIVFHMVKRDWQAFKIVSLPPMQYFDKVSREVATQIGRTQLMANTIADQLSARTATGDEPEDNYANRPDDYANIPA